MANDYINPPMWSKASRFMGYFDRCCPVCESDIAADVHGESVFCTDCNWHVELVDVNWQKLADLENE